MRNLGKWIGRIILALGLAVLVVGLWKREEITRLLAVNSLFEQDRIVGNFSDMSAAFLSTPVPRGTAMTSDLPYGPETDLPPGTADWITDRALTSLLVLKDGQVRYEEYFLDTGPDDLRISWSLAKSYLASLFGVLLDEGAITSLDDPVTQYAPQLNGSAYDGVSIRQVLTMTSGVTFDEDYLDNNSDIKRMGRVVALGGALDDFTASFTDRFVDPGTQWTYVSIDTHVIGMVIRGATGRGIADLLSEKIIAPLGLERDGRFITDGTGTAFVLGGLNFTTRDYGRFGQMILQNGVYEGTQVVPADWIAQATAPRAPTQPGEMGYGYQWWMAADPRPGEFMGRGVYGQYLYINQRRNVVIVVTAADLGFQEPGINETNIEMMRRIADSL